MEATEIVATLRPRLSDALIATDFDGTLAPLVLDPETSRPADGAVEALIALADRGATIAVITGRDAQTALRLGGLDAVPGITVAGLYGAEIWHHGRLSTPDTPPQIAVLRVELPGVIAEADPQVWIEDKRLSLVVHTRRAPDPAGEIARLTAPVTEIGQRLGFEVHPGSDVLEIRLPGFDKAGALSRLADGHGAVLYLGDDLGDIPAFEQILRLRGLGVAALSVGVLSSDAGIADRTDVQVLDPAAVVALLHELAG